MPENTDIKPNWEREKIYKWWTPSKQLLKSIRQYQKFRDQSGLIPKIVQELFILEHRFWSVVTGADIPLNSQLASSARSPTLYFSIKKHPQNQCGMNCRLGF
jgi:serine O-acetyltransferase